MAIPTDFKGPTPAANTTKSFKIFGSTTVGIWALDIDGTLSVSTKIVPLGPNLVIVADQAYTDAQLIPLVQDWLARMGVGVSGSAGGIAAAETTKQVAVVATTCT